MSRIGEKFGELKRSGRGGFIPFITAGDPDLATTERLLIELAKAGADVIELGVPFSDPVADGEVIQRPSERALKHGTTLDKVLKRSAEVRKRSQAGLIIFYGLDPIMRRGMSRFCAAASEAGTEGDLIPK